MKIKNISLKLGLTLSIVSLAIGVMVPKALAEEIVVSGNGEGSNNQVNIAPTNQTTVEQTNTTNVTNDVNTSSNSGDNTASNNTGGSTSVTSGDTSSTTTVSNSGNVSVVTQNDCGCPTPNASSATISGNGEGSTNSIQNIQTNNINISTSNNATVFNNVTSYANTGSNNALGNTGGSVVIRTGNVHSSNIISNLLNLSKVVYTRPNNSDSIQSILNNGEFSLNNLRIVSNTNINIATTNNANVLNNISSLMNTGNNTAYSNTGGDVLITTGAVVGETVISNALNLNYVDVSCGCVKSPPNTPPTHTEVPPATVPSSSGSSSSTSSTSPSSSVLGASTVAAVAGSILPATGGGWLLFILLGNISMFLLGAYLRLRSGRSPGFAFAF